MQTTMKLALGEMSVRRQLLLQSLIERVGERMAPHWNLVESAEDADVLLYDPAAGRPDSRARALPVVERAEQTAHPGLSLCFPPTTAELCSFLEKAASGEHADASVLPASLRALSDAVMALIAGRRAGVLLETGDGLRFGLSVVYGAPRVHSEGDERIAECLQGRGFLPTVRMLPGTAVSGSGSLQQGQFLVWALARELAQHGHALVPADAVLKLRRWPLPPEAFIARADCMRICMRLAPGAEDLRSITRSEQFAAADVLALVNAGAMLGFLQAEAVPVDAAPAAPEPAAAPHADRRYGTLMSALRSAFGLTARAH